MATDHTAATVDINVDIGDLEVDYLVDRACDAFEQSWLGGHRPSIAAHLERVDPAHRGRLFEELLQLDVDYRLRRGERPQRADYAAEFGDLADVIAAASFETVANASTAAMGRLVIGQLAVGMSVGRFTLEKRLGAGAGGEVWQASDPLLRRQVAIKIAHFHRQPRENLRRFIREGRTAARLQHPSIVAVHEVGREGSLAYIVCDLVRGENLRDRLAAQRATHAEAAELAAAVAEALDYAHQQGVIHRDLKPANIMIDGAGRPHVTDFGLAKTSDASRGLTVHGELLGTPAYMAPEQARGEAAAATARADVFALGVMLYEMLVGERPFTGDHAAVIDGLLRHDPTPPRKRDRSIPRDLETICLKALEKDPQRRYARAGDMAGDLRRHLRGEPVLARRDPLPVRAARWVRRRPSAAAVVALALVSAAGIAMAGRLARENRALLGFRPVTLQSVPRGADFTCVPLDPATGEPDAARLAHLGRVEEFELRPGDYLFVAVLDDGRFHEVLRRVPPPDESLPLMWNHTRWQLTDAGEVALPPVKIPPATVAQGMVRVELPLPEAVLEGSAPRRAGTYALYVDPHEFTVGDYQQRRGGRLPLDRRWQPRPADYPLTVSYDEAVSTAERGGKRLPTAAEFEFVATMGGAHGFPWGDGPVDESDLKDLAVYAKPVAEPGIDRLLAAPGLTGLCSNVAEWTTSWDVLGPNALEAREAGRSQTRPAPFSGPGEPRRIVKGGVCEATPRQSERILANRRPSGHDTAFRDAVEPTLGFRGYRSAAPRTGPEDFLPSRLHDIHDAKARPSRRQQTPPPAD